MEKIDDQIKIEEEFQNPEIITNKVRTLIGEEALDLLREHGIEIDLGLYPSQQGGRLEVFYFTAGGRTVTFHGFRITDGKRKPITGVAVNFAFSNPEIPLSSVSKGKDEYDPCREIRPELHEQTLWFLRFMGKFAQAITIHNNVFILPSDNRREELYTRYFTKQPPKGNYSVYILDSRGDIKKRFTGSTNPSNHANP